MGDSYWIRSAWESLKSDSFSDYEHSISDSVQTELSIWGFLSSFSKSDYFLLSKVLCGWISIWALFCSMNSKLGCGTGDGALLISDSIIVESQTCKSSFILEEQGPTPIWRGARTLPTFWRFCSSSTILMNPSCSSFVGDSCLLRFKSLGLTAAAWAAFLLLVLSRLDFLCLHLPD